MIILCHDFYIHRHVIFTFFGILKKIHSVGGGAGFKMQQQDFQQKTTKKNKTENITPILMFLHWLPICFRLDLKFLLVTFKALLIKKLKETKHLLLIRSVSSFKITFKHIFLMVKHSFFKIPAFNCFSYSSTVFYSTLFYSENALQSGIKCHILSCISYGFKLLFLNYYDGLFDFIKSYFNNVI